MNSIIAIILKMDILSMPYLHITWMLIKILHVLNPTKPQYKKLKNGEFTSLNMRITDQNNNIITDGPQVTVVLHIHECK